MHLTSRSLFIGLLIGGLIFSQPVIILAQQNSVEVQAKLDAERDADADVDKRLWILMGGGMFVVTTGLTLFGIGEACKSGLQSSSPGDACAGALISIIGIPALTGYGMNAIINRIPPPPAERLLGKSPQYINFYNDAYKKRVKRVRSYSVLAGTLISGVGIIAGAVISEKIKRSE